MIVNLEDMRKQARRRLPRAVFDFIEGAAEGESTARRNCSGFDRVTLRNRVLVNVGRVDPSTTVLGQRLEVPIILAPAGLCGMAAPRAEVPCARAATRAGAVFTVSTLSTVTLEEVMQEAPGPHWFQLYVHPDRKLTRGLIERARAAGYKALVLTVDVPVVGRRERDHRNGVTIPPKITLRNAMDTARKLRWLWNLVRDPIEFANFRDPSDGTRRRVFGRQASLAGLTDATLSWEDLKWFRSLWPGPLAIKGIMSGADARMAVEHGMDAVIVSNHGGRQLDGVPGAIEVLPEVVEAVSGRAEVILDGGVRRGSDAVKAIALGARACMVGRPYLYGLAAGGEKGVDQVLSILRTDIERTLVLLGCGSLAALDRSFVRVEGGPTAESGITAAGEARPVAMSVSGTAA